MSSQMVFEDREHAARLLGQKLEKYLMKKQILISKQKILVLAIPRGGIITGDIIASHLGVDLDIVVSRKIGTPWNSELALGAVMQDGTFYPNEEVIDMLNLPQHYIDEQKALQVMEIERRLKRFRGGKEYLNYDRMKGKTVILVDDGIATGATIFAAIKWMIKQETKQIIVAVPVGPRDTIEKLRREDGVSDVIVLSTPPEFRAVGQFYREFSQVEDDTVVQIMKKYNQTPTIKAKNKGKKQTNSNDDNHEVSSR
ncbi:MAG: phosphoribosyltransferase family protein [Nitrososphaeraceae archaeon]